MKNQMINLMGRFGMNIILTGTILFFMAVVSFGQEIGLPNDPLSGQTLFIDKECVDCHSIYGNGGKVGRDLGKTLTHVGATGIAAMIWNHSPDMAKLMQKPVKMPVFSGHEMADLMAFLYFLPYFDQMGSADKGETVVRQKGCLTCHKGGGANGATGPPLDTVQIYANPLSLAEAMWDHGMKMNAKMAHLGIQRPTFSSSEIRDLFAYLREATGKDNWAVSYLQPGSPRVGERLFQEKGCLHCHRIRSKGEAIGPDLTRIDFHKGAALVAATLWNHGPKILEEMQKRQIAPPVFKENEMADLTAYLYFLDYVEQRGDADAGKGIFKGKGCVKCHAIWGKGGNVGPDLARSDVTVDRIKTTAAMWNHNQKMQILMDKVGVPMPRFSEKEMKDLFFYLRTERMKYEY